MALTENRALTEGGEAQLQTFAPGALPRVAFGIEKDITDGVLEVAPTKKEKQIARHKKTIEHMQKFVDAPAETLHPFKKMAKKTAPQKLERAKQNLKKLLALIPAHSPENRDRLTPTVTALYASFVETLSMEVPAHYAFHKASELSEENFEDWSEQRFNDVVQQQRQSVHAEATRRTRAFFTDVEFILHESRIQQTLSPEAREKFIKTQIESLPAYDVVHQTQAARNALNTYIRDRLNKRTVHHSTSLANEVLRMTERKIGLDDTAGEFNLESTRAKYQKLLRKFRSKLYKLQRRHGVRDTDLSSQVEHLVNILRDPGTDKKYRTRRDKRTKIKTREKVTWRQDLDNWVRDQFPKGTEEKHLREEIDTFLYDQAHLILQQKDLTRAASQQSIKDRLTRAGTIRKKLRKEEYVRTARLLRLSLPRTTTAVNYIKAIDKQLEHIKKQRAFFANPVESYNLADHAETYIHPHIDKILVRRIIQGKFLPDAGKLPEKNMTAFKAAYKKLITEYQATITTLLKLDVDQFDRTRKPGVLDERPRPHDTSAEGMPRVKHTRSRPLPTGLEFLGTFLQQAEAVLTDPQHSNTDGTYTTTPVIKTGATLDSVLTNLFTTTAIAPEFQRVSAMFTRIRKRLGRTALKGYTIQRHPMPTTVGAPTPRSSIDVGTKQIFLRPEDASTPGLDAFEVVHEALHALTAEYILNNPTDKAVQSVQNIWEELLGDAQLPAPLRKLVDNIQRETSPTQQVAEFLTHAYTNSYLIDYLKDAPSKDNFAQTLWKKLMNAVRNILGISIKDKTLLSDIIAAGTTIMDAQATEAWTDYYLGLEEKLAHIKAQTFPRTTKGKGLGGSLLTKYKRPKQAKKDRTEDAQAGYEKYKASATALIKEYQTQEIAPNEHPSEELLRDIDRKLQALGEEFIHSIEDPVLQELAQDLYETVPNAVPKLYSPVDTELSAEQVAQTEHLFKRLQSILEKHEYDAFTEEGLRKVAKTMLPDLTLDELETVISKTQELLAQDLARKYTKEEAAIAAREAVAHVSTATAAYTKKAGAQGVKKWVLDKYLTLQGQGLHVHSLLTLLTNFDKKATKALENIFVRPVNASVDEYLTQIASRKQGIVDAYNKKAAELGVDKVKKVQDLIDQIYQTDDIYIDAEKVDTFMSRSEAMFYYIARNHKRIQKNLNKSAHTNGAYSAYLKSIKKQLSPAEKFLADLIREDLANNYDRHADALIKTRPIIINRLLKPDFAQQLQPETIAKLRNNELSDEQIKHLYYLFPDHQIYTQEPGYVPAIPVSAFKQTELVDSVDKIVNSHDPLKSAPIVEKTHAGTAEIVTDLFQVWKTARDTQEHFISHAETVDRLWSTYRAPTPNGKKSLQATIRAMSPQLDTALQVYMNSITDPRAHLKSSAHERLWSHLRRWATLGFLGFNITTMLKQPVSLVYALRWADSGVLANTLSDYMSRPKKRAEIDEFCKKFPQIKWRNMEEIIDDLSHGQDSALSAHFDAFFKKRGVKNTAQARKKYIKWAMGGIQWMDRHTVNMVFYSSYQTALRKGLSKEAAEQYAHKAIFTTQPASHVKDTAAAYKAGPLQRTLMIFTNQLNKIWNLGSNEVMFKALMQGFEGMDKQWWKTLSSLSLGAVVIGLATQGGRLEDDDPETNVLQDYTGHMLVGATSTIPLIGKAVTSSIQGHTTPANILFAAVTQMNQVRNTAIDAFNGDAEWLDIFRPITRTGFVPGGIQANRGLNALREGKIGKLWNYEKVYEPKDIKDLKVFAPLAKNAIKASRNVATKVQQVRRKIRTLEEQLSRAVIIKRRRKLKAQIKRLKRGLPGYEERKLLKSAANRYGIPIKDVYNYYPGLERAYAAARI